METARPARVDDVGRIVELAAALRDEMARYRGGDLWMGSQHRSLGNAEAVNALIAASDVRVVVGCIDDVVVGYGIGVIDTLIDGARVATITEIFVEPGAREVGVGEQLVEVFLRWAAEEQCVGVDATARPGHRAAKNFFEEQGFVARSLTMHRNLGTPDHP